MSVSLDCSCFIALSVFYNIYLSCVLSTLCYQFLCVLLPFHLFVLCLVHPMLPVSLDCSCFIALSVFSNIYLSCVLSTLCCQFFWIVHVLLPFRYSITFICPVSCLLYVTSFSGLFMFYYPVSIL